MPRFHNINNVRVQFTPEEETARDAEEKAWADTVNDRSFADLRQERNNLLLETDFYGSSDVTMPSNIKTYRQNLRDLPATVDINDWPNITWPTKPS